VRALCRLSGGVDGHVDRPQHDSHLAQLRRRSLIPSLYHPLPRWLLAALGLDRLATTNLVSQIKSHRPNSARFCVIDL
jgi:hypothetical protein